MMKSIIYLIKSNTIQMALVIIIALLISACNGETASVPGLVIYKTKADYIDRVHVRINRDSTIRSFTTYGMLGQRVNIIDSLDSLYLWRTKLVDGYVLDGGFCFYDGGAFLNMTIKEYIRIADESQDNAILADIYSDSLILDAEPFLEYYWDPNDPRAFQYSDTIEINEIIRKGELEKYFKRIK